MLKRFTWSTASKSKDQPLSFNLDSVFVVCQRYGNYRKLFTYMFCVGRTALLLVRLLSYKKDCEGIRGRYVWPTHGLGTQVEFPFLLFPSSSVSVGHNEVCLLWPQRVGMLPLFLLLPLHVFPRCRPANLRSQTGLVGRHSCIPEWHCAPVISSIIVCCLL